MVKYPNTKTQVMADWVVLEPRRFWTRIIDVRVRSRKVRTEDTEVGVAYTEQVKKQEKPPRLEPQRHKENTR